MKNKHTKKDQRSNTEKHPNHSCDQRGALMLKINYSFDGASNVTSIRNYASEANTLGETFENNFNPSETTSLGIYRFNSKKKDYESGFHYYGARYYWGELLTGWLSVDPMADKYPNISPYAYCSWNPILFIDPNGEEKLIYFNVQKPSVYSFSGQKNAHSLYKMALKQWKSNVNLKNSASKYRNHNGVIHLFAHGSTKNINISGNGKKGAEDLYLFLANVSETYKKNIAEGKTSLILLHSCQTGKGDHSVGQELSSTGDMLVIAPSKNVSLGNDEHVTNNGVWNVFYKGELLGKYSGNIDFQRQLERKDPQGIIVYWKNKYNEKHNQHKND